MNSPRDEKIKMSCGNELEWKSQVWSKYGIKKKYGKTWEDTALLFCKSNMINLGTKWVNGQTYGELLEEALESDGDLFADILLKKYELYRFKVYIYPEYVKEIRDEMKYMEELYHDYSDNSMTQEMLDLTSCDDLEIVLRIITREFSVIYHAFEEIRSHYNLISARRENDVRNYGDKLSDSENQIAHQIRSLVDPIPYVMMYSLQSLKTLNVIRFFP